MGNSGDNSGRFKKGADARRAVGRKGVGGRKPLAFKAECDQLADAEVLPKMRAYLAAHDPSDPAWRWCAQTVLEYSKQKAAQDVNLGAQPGFAFSLNLGGAAVTDGD